MHQECPELTLVLEQVRNIIRECRCIKYCKAWCKKLCDRDLLEWSDAEDLKNFMQTWLQSMGFLEDRDQEVSTDGRPDLDANGIGRSAHECTDPQVLFDPTKEQFDLPAGFVNLSDLEGR